MKKQKTVSRFVAGGAREGWDAKRSGKELLLQHCAANQALRAALQSCSKRQKGVPDLHQAVGTAYMSMSLLLCLAQVPPLWKETGEQPANACWRGKVNIRKGTPWLRWQRLKGLDIACAVHYQSLGPEITELITQKQTYCEFMNWQVTSCNSPK